MFVFVLFLQSFFKNILKSFISIQYINCVTVPLIYGLVQVAMEETLEKLQNSSTKMEEAEKEFKDKEEDVNAQSRRVLLLEEEVSYSLS